MITAAWAIGSPAAMARRQNPSSIDVSLSPANPAATTQSAIFVSELMRCSGSTRYVDEQGAFRDLSRARARETKKDQDQVIENP
jgi:hypothetical protein